MLGGLEIYLAATLGGVVQVLAGKVVDGSLGDMAKELIEGGDKLELEQVRAAIRASVTDAQRGSTDEVAALLDAPPVAEALTGKLLFDDPINFNDLGLAYQDLLLDPQVEQADWPELTLPLLRLFKAVQQSLDDSPDLRPLLAASRDLASLGELGDTRAILLATRREIQPLMSRTADATERTAMEAAASRDLLAEIRTLSGREEILLGEILAVLRQLAAKDGAREGQALALASVELGPAEEAYLHLLYDKCDALPLAEEQRDVNKNDSAPRASLANVYVDLETTTTPTVDRVFQRLGVPEAKRPGVLTALERLAPKDGSGRGEAKAMGGEGVGVEMLKLGDPSKENHPLHSWFKDEETFAATHGPITALEALEHNYLVLLGDPGSGKSTFVSHLARTLAGGLLGREPDWRTALEERFVEPLFPLRIVLRQWSTRLALDAERPVDRFYAELEALCPNVDPKRWLARLHKPGTLLLFDGLDEVPTGSKKTAADRRRLILAAIEGVCIAHPHCKVVVTCRWRPWEEGRHQLRKASVFRLAPLDEGRIERFVRLWYRELARLGGPRASAAEDRAQRLRTALRERPALRKMAGPPLLLTMLAQVNAYTQLPEGRAELYEVCVEQLLWKWEQAKAEDGGGSSTSLETLLARPQPPLRRIDLERMLRQLTYEAHGRSGAELADPPVNALRDALEALHAGDAEEAAAWAKGVLTLMHERGGLLDPSAKVFTFPHRGFQEYLAARHLLEKPNAPALAYDHAKDDSWSEVVLLACGYGGAREGQAIVQGIIHTLIAGRASYSKLARRRLLLAGRAWHESGLHRTLGKAKDKAGAELAKTLARRLTAMMQRAALPQAERLEAGLVLADLEVLPKDLDAWVEIPADVLP